ncbi:alpha/beta-hydrolase [Punctularia strigosozonata HHB-11173 SS5]|uniref:alpha/beta-hydrolase n=1 Tax=Punctularia strigosozonata (strain HHB-11173) TaxID=741275 RepID=UPI00044172F1|nr:alpha/beta-hydrolase [Punctularia strigosozonata HHB-11173 SS5]EIN09463.1 alpha/beta-hydrolase [Punctularia strigosozonata HHB-11173 SS5]
MSFCKDCISGVINEGEPAGKIEKIDGVDVYVATPEIDYPKDKVILFLPDVFGLAQNNKLVADAFAKNGFKTILPDYLNGDPISEDVLTGKVPGFTINDWFANHGPDKTRPPLDKVINALKTQGVTIFGATGYCLGARYAFDLAFENIPKAVVVNHPSLLEPSDLEKYFSVSKAPLLINSCEVDQMFPAEKQAKADEIFGNGKFAPGYTRLYWEGCTHGFAVRGDVSDPKVKAGKEGAFKAAVEFFIKNL